MIINKINEYCYEILNGEKHCITIENNLNEVPGYIEEYNCKTEVDNNEMFNSVLKVLNVKYVKALVIMKNKELLNDFINLIK